MHDKVGDMLFRFGRQAREFPRAEFTLIDVFAPFADRSAS